MFSLIVNRVIQLVISIWSLITIVFFLQRSLPGNPADAVLGIDASDVEKMSWLAQYGLDKGLIEQYFVYLKNLLLYGDLGRSFSSFTPVSEILYPRLKETLWLALASFLVSLFLAFVIGIWSAAQAGKIVDKIFTFSSLLVISSPNFVIGPLLIWVFSIKLDLLPLMGKENFLSFVLPSLTLGSSLAAFSSRLIRGGILEVLNEDYIRTALSKGLSRYQILIKHALKNAILPTITILGMQLGVLLSGAIITEQIFNWPGLGSLLIEAIQQREYNIISACVIVLASVYVICNLLVDILYQFMDPRVKNL